MIDSPINYSLNPTLSTLPFTSKTYCFLKLILIVKVRKIIKVRKVRKVINYDLIENLTVLNDE